MSKELYEKVHWFDKRSRYEFVTAIKNGLLQLTSSYLRHYNLSPFDFYNREDTIVSHLAVASDRARHFVIQEHTVVSSNIRKPRPDLLIRYGTKPRESCVFEAKKLDIRADMLLQPTDLDNGIKLVGEAWEQMTEYSAKAAAHQCAIVGMRLYVGTRDIYSEWSYETEAQQRKSYYDRFNAVYFGLKRKVKEIPSNSKCVPNFCWGYALRHKLAVCERERVIEKGERQVAIGMLWLGRVSQSIRISG